MFFSWEKHIISHFLGFFEGASTFLTSLRSGQFRREKSLGPLKKPREMADYVFFPSKET
jgi:hypothetical protein